MIQISYYIHRVTKEYKINYQNGLPLKRKYCLCATIMICRSIVLRLSEIFDLILKFDTGLSKLSPTPSRSLQTVDTRHSDEIEQPEKTQQNNVSRQLPSA